MTRWIIRLLNPWTWWRAWRFHRAERFEKSRHDAELALYGRVFESGMLHYGYFDDPEMDPRLMGIGHLDAAQVRYAERIAERVIHRDLPVLDIGCGMGGLKGILLERGVSVEALTPNDVQIAHLCRRFPTVPLHACRFESLAAGRRFGTLVNAESLQYIDLDRAFAQAEAVLVPGGRWIVVDYFRRQADPGGRPPHPIADFRARVRDGGWRIAEEQDITANVLPTLRFADLYANRVVLPALDFAFRKLRQRRAWLFYLLQDLHAVAAARIERERGVVDPARFVRERQYLLFFLERP